MHGHECKSYFTPRAASFAEKSGRTLEMVFDTSRNVFSGMGNGEALIESAMLFAPRLRIFQCCCSVQIIQSLKSQMCDASPSW